VRTCPSCRQENDDSARFCVACGTALLAVCAECGAEIPPGAGFCPACGAPVVAQAQPSGEERKVVTVLFADLVDSTRHGEQLDPEDLRGLLSPYFTRVRGEIERFGGTVEKFIGDAVMAVFGAPAAHEDDPERAVRAALAVRDAVAELNESSEVDLHVRIAVNTGEAVVALGASPESGEGMVAGDVVNTCSRLESAAPTDGILVGKTTYHATADAVEYREAAPVDAKGKSEPVLAWEALGSRPEPERPSTPLVGRWQELSQLLDAIVRVREERSPQLVSLVGVPGIGKTRLVRELYNAVDAERDGAGWLRGRCLPYGDGVSFAALAEMARAEAGIRTTDSDEQAAAKLRAAVEALPGDADPAWLEAHLRPLVGLASDVTERREDSFAAWRRFFEGLAERGPLVLVFEDLHWADPGVLDFIDHLVDWASGVPLLVLCTARPELLERRPGWGGGKRNAITISLSPLSDEETGELVGALLGEGDLPEGLAKRLLTRAGGNPLYTEEFARMLLERGFLVRENGSWRLAEPELPLPESVQGTIAARVDGLPYGEKTVLQQAAVIGKVFWLGAVAQAFRLGREETEQLVHGLERKEFVRRERHSSIADEVQYAFRHVLVRDVAYGQLPRARRADAHVRVAAWLESLQGGGEELAEQLAYHYQCALELQRVLGEDTHDLATRAAPALHQAGTRALSLNAFRAALRFFDSELELLPADSPARPYALLGLGKARAHAEGAGIAELEQAFEGVMSAGDLESAADVASSLTPLLWSRGEADRVAHYLERATGLVEELPATTTKAIALSRIASVQSVGVNPDEAIRTARAALELAELTGGEETKARAYGALATARTTRGDWEGFEDFQRSLDIALALKSPTAILSYINYAGSKMAYGDLPGAFQLQEMGRRLAEELDDARLTAWLQGERITEYYFSARWDEAVELADEVIQAPSDSPLSYMAVPARLVRSHVRHHRGDRGGSAEDADEALSRALEIGDFQLVVPARVCKARLLLTEDRTVEAGKQLDAALALIPGREVWASYAWADLAAVLAVLDRTVPKLDATSRWIDAARATIAGDHVAAAGFYRTIGSLPDEAVARLQAAETLAAAEDRTAAEVQLASALSFFRSVGASARLADAEALLSSA
jgi:class 3 adenylate cyclase/tetratricopeptide (TPR) repeat protein